MRMSHGGFVRSFGVSLARQWPSRTASTPRLVEIKPHVTRNCYTVGACLAVCSSVTEGILSDDDLLNIR